MGYVSHTHGHSRNGKVTRTYSSWQSMIARCYHENLRSYPRYGGSGITVCDGWMTFAGFLADMGTRPNGATLDRINNELGYTPENCRWASPKEQALNRRTNHHITANGEKLTLSQWDERNQFYPGTVRARLLRGWNEIDAVTKPRLQDNSHAFR